MRLSVLATLITLITFVSCSGKKENTQTTHISNAADSILTAAIKKHGGDHYEMAHFQFAFRGKTYTFKNDSSRFTYTRSQINGSDTIEDILNNDGFTRTLNGTLVDTPDSMQSKYAESINSVIYFATLPYKLQDPAVHSNYMGKTSIGQNEYHAIKITFSEENGGSDFDDEYYYWVQDKTNTIDYFAYNYTVNGGGVRFRAGYNPRIIEGIYFQDYVNYKADVGTPLENLPNLYDLGQLEKLSLIETDSVISLKH